MKTPEEKAKDFGIPLIPKIKPVTTKPMNPHSPVAICGECGLELHRIMGYVCSNNNCPCFPRTT